MENEIIDSITSNVYKVLRILVDSEKVCEDDGVAAVCVTQSEIANKMNLNVMTINRVMKYLEFIELIKQRTRGVYLISDKAKVIVRDIEALRECVEE